MISVNHDVNSLSWNWVSYKYIYLKKLITFHLFKYIYIYIYIYIYYDSSRSLRESMCPILYQLSLVRIHFIYFWSVQHHFKIRKIWMIIFDHFKSIRRLKMILHRDFMVPITDFYRMRDLHRDLRSISEQIGKKKKNFFHHTTFRHISYFRHTISYFLLDKVVILMTS